MSDPPKRIGTYDGLLLYIFPLLIIILTNLERIRTQKGRSSTGLLSPYSRHSPIPLSPSHQDAIFHDPEITSNLAVFFIFSSYCLYLSI